MCDENTYDCAEVDTKPPKLRKRDLLARIEALQAQVNVLQQMSHAPCAGPHWTVTYPNTTTYPIKTWPYTSPNWSGSGSYFGASGWGHIQ